MRFESLAVVVLLGLGGCGGSEPTDTDSATISASESSGTSSGPTSSGPTSSGSADESTSDGGTGPLDESSSDASSGGSTDESTTEVGPTQVQFDTTLGTIVFELDEVAAPITSANFLAYVDAGFYDGTDGLEPTIVHRIVPGFVIQGGGLTEALESKATMPAIVNESGNGLTNVRGAISMARTKDPDSATSQFFVNLVDNDGCPVEEVCSDLDAPPGYAVFGMVVEGMDVVDAMAAVDTQMDGPFAGVPVEPIIVMSATRL